MTMLLKGKVEPYLENAEIVAALFYAQRLDESAGRLRAPSPVRRWRRIRRAGAPARPSPARRSRPRSRRAGTGPLRSRYATTRSALSPVSERMKRSAGLSRATLQRRRIGALVDRPHAALRSMALEPLRTFSTSAKNGDSIRSGSDARHGPHVEDEAAFAREDVGRGAAVDLPNGQRRPRRIEIRTPSAPSASSSRAMRRRTDISSTASSIADAPMRGSEECAALPVIFTS